MRNYRVLVEYDDGDSWDKEFDDSHEALDFYRKCSAMRRMLMEHAVVSAQRRERDGWKTVFKSESYGLAWF